MAISLGVGCSTLAIINFFSAIADGTIDDTERRMMGIVYVVLRVSMVLILVTTLFLGVTAYTSGTDMYFTGHWYTSIAIITMLYGNALLMTLRLVPSTVGPGIQAGSWYTLGLLQALVPFGVSTISATSLLIGYGAMLALAISVVNAILAVLKQRRSMR
jgi:hypothetical protein